MREDTARRRFLSVCSAAMIGISGCSTIEEVARGVTNDGANTSKNQTSDATGSGNGEDGEGVTETTDDGSSLEDTQINSAVLDLEQVPADYSLIEESESVDSFTGENSDDSLRAYYKKAYVSSEGADNVISSEAMVFENQAAASREKTRQKDTLLSTGGKSISGNADYTISTDIIEAETTDGDRVRYYFGQQQNLLLEIMFVGDFATNEMSNMYSAVASTL